MSKANPLAGLIGNYGGDSDEDSDGGVGNVSRVRATTVSPRGPPPTQPGMLPGADSASTAAVANAAIHPAPIAHCPWSACYDEGSGFTYYWNQSTNEVTWEAPREYLLALKVAQQHMQTAGTTEVSAEEWQLYQQALADKQLAQSKPAAKPVAAKPATVPISKKVDTKKYAKKRPTSYASDDEEKIELITSYYNSDSESNDESDGPAKSTPGQKIRAPKPVPKTNPEPKPKKKKKKEESAVPFGPSLPSNLEYTVPIGPELPPGPARPKEVAEIKQDAVSEVKSGTSTPKSTNTEDITDEKELLSKLKDKAKLLAKLGGELPNDLQKMIHDDSKSVTSSPRLMDMDVDNLLEEIEKTELPKLKSKAKIDMFHDDTPKSKETSVPNSPQSVGDKTPPRDEFKPLFPSSKVAEEEKPPTLFPSSINIKENGVEIKQTEIVTVPEKTEKKPNVYIMDSNEPIEKVGRKKLRISNSVLPERKKTEPVSYTTKYSQHIEGFSSERTGLGFSKEDDETETTKTKNVVSYGNGLSFTKGEVLNEEKPDYLLDDLTDLLDAKLSFLNQVQPCMVPPVAEMTIQMQTLRAAFTSGALTRAYWRRWLAAAEASLARLEDSAAPQGWTCIFHRSSGRYQYRRLADGLEQWEFPAAVPTDMDICTTPPHAPAERESPPPPPLPPLPPAAPPAPAWAPPAPPPPPAPPTPPPGCDELPPTPPPPNITAGASAAVAVAELPKQEIGDQLLSFYSEIGELELTVAKSSPERAARVAAPAPALAPRVDREKEKPDRKLEEREKESKKKKSKVKISSSIGLKHKTVSSMVAKWQQVAEEINSD